MSIIIILSYIRRIYSDHNLSTLSYSPLPQFWAPSSSQSTPFYLHIFSWLNLDSVYKRKHEIAVLLNLVDVT